MGADGCPIRIAYAQLKAAGMLRGTHLDDKVVVDGSLVMGRGVGLAVALSKMGSFDRIHVEQCRSTGKYTVAKDTLEWKLKRLESIVACCPSSYDEEAWNEWVDAVKAVGGPDAVARWLVTNGGAR